MPELHTLETKKTGRFFVAGPRTPKDSDKVLVALHGYGQLPEFFMRKFAPAVEAGWTVIAPEGLHRFYVEGTSGRVGASWMTREAREEDIADTLNWLDQIRTHLLGSVRPKHCVLLGFSQGVPAAVRWAVRNSDWDALILWAGVFPPDVEPDALWRELKGIPIHTALGSEDPFFDDRLRSDTGTALEAAGLTHHHHPFEGKHAVDGPTLLEVLETIVAPQA